MNKISSRQLYFFLACIAPVGKFVIMPARLSFHTGSDLLLPALAHYLLHAAAIFLVLLLAKRGMSFFELLSNAFGKAIGGILTLLFSAFLLYASFLPLLEQKVFVQGTFYDTIPSVIAFAPFFLISAYFCSKPLRNFGRVWDILAPISIVGIVGILVLSVTTADYGALLPIGSAGGWKLLKGTAYTFSWFFDSALLLMLLGKFDYKKGMALKGALCYLGGGLFVLLFIATFYGVFQEMAINQIFAFSKTSKYFSGMTVLGRVDFIFIYALALVMIFYCSMPMQAAIDGALQVFGRKPYLPELLAIGVNLAALILLIVFDFRFGEVLSAVSEKFFWVYPIFTIGVPLFCLLLRRKRHEIS